MVDEQLAMVNKDNIYESTVDSLGLTLDGTDGAFKTEILGHINSCLGILFQAGCGNDIYADETTLWDAFLGNSKSKGMAKQYVFQRTKMLFDPPMSSTLKAIQDSNNELIWRININDGGSSLGGDING